MKAEIQKRSISEGQSLLSMLKARKWDDAQKFLREHHPDCNVRDHAGNTPLHLILKEIFDVKTTIGLIKGLLSGGADPSLKNHRGQTVLHMLLPHPYRRLGDFASLLLEAGADIDAQDNEGKTYLFQLSGSHHPEDKIQEWVDLGAKIDVRDFAGRTMLHNMIQSRVQSQTRLNYLIKLGVDAKSVDYSGNTLLHEAILSRIDIEMVEKLLKLGLSLDQANYAGLTPVHLLCSMSLQEPIANETKHYIREILSKSKNINALDHNGVTPLHLASTISECLVDELLKLGSDPTLATFEGLTALHLSSRARQSNIVGRLAESISVVDPVKRLSFINAKDQKGRTPLYHACRSGRPETVAILLDAGADPRITAERNQTVFEACLEFEDEQELWFGYGTLKGASDEIRSTMWEAGRGHMIRSYVSAAGTRLEDTSRPFVNRISRDINKYLGRGSTTWINTCHDTTRLEEILDMLYNQALKSADDKSWAQKTIKSCFHQAICRQGYEYTFRCFEQLWEKVEPGAGTPQYLSRSFNPLIHKYLRQVLPRVVEETEDIKVGRSNAELLNHLLKDREYELVESLFHRGTNFMDNWDESFTDFPHRFTNNDENESNLHFLAKYGFASLLEKIGSIEAEARFEEGAWHAAGDPKRAGLGVCCRGPGFHYPLLLTACQRELPNMDIVRVLVENLGVDVNAQDKASVTDDYHKEIIPGGISALHHLALGSYWWQVAEGIPYLVTTARANINLRNDNGETPLHVALRSSGVFQTQAAQALVNLGADVNALDGKGIRCLAAAGTPDLFRLLQSRGAIITASALFGGIDSKTVNTLERVLTTGIDPNIRPDGAHETLEVLEEDRDWTGIFPLEFGMDPQEWYALQYAASTRSNAGPWNNHACTAADRANQIGQVTALLIHGANPYIVYRQPIKYPKAGDVRYVFPADVADNTDVENDAPSESEDSGNEEQETASVDSLIWPSSVPRRYGLRSIIHSLLEDSDVIRPLLELPTLELEHRDPQGRTLLLSACRSALGADAAIDYTILDYRLTLSRKSFFSIPEPTTPLQYLLNRGADPLARDYRGKNALHHLLEAHDYITNLRPPLIRKSLQHMANNFPELVNQSDNDGNFPLHTALQRIRRYVHDDMYTFLAEIGACVEDLLIADAHPSAVDGKGNNALHYLVLESKCLKPEDHKPLLRLFLDRGLDTNVVNSAGHTPFSLWLDDTCRRKSEVELGYEEPAPIDQEVLGWFDEAGTKWDQRDEKGRTLLHILARHKTPNAVEAFQYLLGKGVDGMLKDKNGRTAWDIATRRKNVEILKFHGVVKKKS